MRSHVLILLPVDLRYGSVYHSQRFSCYIQHGSFSMAGISDSPFRIRFHVFPWGAYEIIWPSLRPWISPPRYLVKAGRQRLGISTEFSMGPELEIFFVMEKCRVGGFHWRPATSTSHGGWNPVRVWKLGFGVVELRYYDLLEASKGNRLARLVS